MRGFTIYLALFVFSLSSAAISDMSVVDDAGVPHLVYIGDALPNQGLNISEDQMLQMQATGTQQPSATDIIGQASFALFTLVPMLLHSMVSAFYVVGWLGAWGVPGAMAWVVQGSLWCIYGWDVMQIMTNRSLKAFE